MVMNEAILLFAVSTPRYHAEVFLHSTGVSQETFLIVAGPGRNVAYTKMDGETADVLTTSWGKRGGVILSRLFTI